MLRLQLQMGESGFNYTYTKTGLSENVLILYILYILHSYKYLTYYRNLSINMIRRAEKCGFEALVLTVDAPYFGKRRSNIRDGFKLPPHLRYAY